LLFHLFSFVDIEIRLQNQVSFFTLAKEASKMWWYSSPVS